MNLIIVLTDPVARTRGQILGATILNYYSLLLRLALLLGMLRALNYVLGLLQAFLTLFLMTIFID